MIRRYTGAHRAGKVAQTMKCNSVQGSQDIYPQVLLLGNGLNRAFGGGSWRSLIDTLGGNQTLEYRQDLIEKVPFPLQAVLFTKDRIDTTIRKNRASLCLCADDLSDLVKTLKPIWGMGFDHILTTNYSYELECAADSKFDKRCCHNKTCHGECPFKAAMQYTRKHAETHYLLHTYNAVVHEGREQKIWHIHGEARKPDSVILGHYFYGKLLQRYDKLLSERGNKQYARQQNGEPPILESWLDAFIMGDVYILGFGCDFSEWDIWWLLNRKKRERARHGKTVFYEPQCEDLTVKQALLRTYDVDVRNLGFDSSRLTDKGENNPTIFFRTFYQKAIEDIQNQCQIKKEQ